MTSPIKPPGGGPPKIPAAEDAARGADGANRSESKAEAFQAAVESQSVDGPRGASNSTASSAVGEVANELRSGAIDAATAVDRLVAQTLSSPMAAGLDDAGRAALEVHLRESLADDPNIAGLVRDLERAG